MNHPIFGHFVGTSTTTTLDVSQPSNPPRFPIGTIALVECDGTLEPLNDSREPPRAWRSRDDYRN